ncbi:MAG TPA: hypothetical protein VHO90_11130 [Bacteroidales bacterium]|nr:hypothetical protein [Bacteroidales bacterium]
MSKHNLNIKMTLFEKIQLIRKIINYNLKIVFANKFIYFLIAAWLFYLIIIGIMLFSDGSPDISDIYDTIILPGILMMFYPVVYNIQNDKDARMLEIVFGVPNYRYKVYIVRFAIAILLLVVLLLLMAGFAWLSVVKIPVLEMVYQIIFPLFFLACVTFLFSTITRNGNATAVVMIIIGLVFFFLNEPLRNSKWNLFLNPFNIPMNMNMTVWMNVVYQNRLMMMIGAVIALLWGLANLQRRERFV